MVCIFANCKKIYKVKNYTDIIIVGAGLSGVGAACHLERKNREKSYVIFEAREELGGTWSLFKYPGIRSDSDMYTCLLYTSPSPRDKRQSRMPSSA